MSLRADKKWLLSCMMAVKWMLFSSLDTSSDIAIVKVEGNNFPYFPLELRYSRYR